MGKQQKYYVVWEGKVPGIYRTWDTCKVQVEGFEQAKYKSFETEAEAKKAFTSGWKSQYRSTQVRATIATNRPIGEFLAVDAACSGNPGPMEYRGVYSMTGTEVFRQGPYENGTNNIGEFLAIVHALALQTKNGTTLPIYSDSANAITWVRKKKCNTKLEEKTSNKAIFDLIERAESWLETHKTTITILKWETSRWGEIPADFGRK
jgi:ribonuclease HI